jgi:branched-chain amino acid transport system permease protein
MIWVETVMNGIFLGSLYGVLGLGLALVFGVMRVINIAHGEFIVLAAYFGVALTAALPGVHPILFLVPIAIAAFAVGWVFQTAFLNRVVESRNMLVPMLLTFGVSIVLRNAMLEIFGANPMAVDAGSFSRMSFDLGGLRVGFLPLATLVIALGLFALLHFVVRQTRFGRIVRATADNPDVMRLMGVDPRRVYAIVMGVALALAGVAGLLLAMRTSFTATSGVDRILIAFEVVVLGGMGSFWGALLAGILLGVTQLVGFRFDSNSGLLYAHMLFFIFLIIRPNGLLGART